MQTHRAGRSGIRKLIDIRSTAFLLLLTFVLVTVGGERAGNPVPDAGSPVAGSRLAVAQGQAIFPMGWYDRLQSPELLPSMRSTGMNAVLPYVGSARGSTRSYLDHARRSGMKVFVQIDPLLLSPPNPVLIRNFVANYRRDSAVYGWLLVDEPTVNTRYAALTPSMATMIYKQIKAADPVHPVAIVFGSSEDPRPFIHAMDVLMYDDFAQCVNKPEFWGLDAWRARIGKSSALAAHLDGYMPVLQAFGQDTQGRPQIQKRLPTSKEMRYITYTAIQYHATGLFFWVRYRSRKDWIDRVLTPLSKEISPALHAMAAGPITGSAGVGSVRSMLFRDPSSKALYLVVVHHGSGSIKGQVNLLSGLHVSRASSTNGVHDVSGGKLVDAFGPYAARMYRLS